MKDKFSYGIELREILGHHKNLFEEKYTENKFIENMENLTKKSNDSYLEDRGEKYKEFVGNDLMLKDYLGRLKFEKINHEYIKKYFNSYCISLRDSIKDGFNFIDLFCGSGGLSLGFIQEGFNVNLACDFDSSCIETYRFNHPNIESKYVVHCDIREIENDITKYVYYPNVDVVIGGPPCQGFSIANQQRLIDDPRNELYKSFVNVVEKTTPKVFIMENVKGMLKVAKQVKEDFENAGYNVSYNILQAKLFGVPQNRERLIFIGTRMDIDIEIDEVFNLIKKEYIKTPYVLKDALSDLNILKASTKKNDTNFINVENGGIVTKRYKFHNTNYIKLINGNDKVYPVIFNHQARYNNDRDIEIYSKLNQGDKSDDPKIADIMPYSNRNHIFKDKYYKLREDEICKTITAHMRFDCNMYIHPNQSRGLTPREAARIQSYPDDYIFKGAYTKTYMQIGNSVPPLMGRGIAKIIKQILRR